MVQAVRSEDYVIACKRQLPIKSLGEKWNESKKKKGGRGKGNDPCLSFSIFYCSRPNKTLLRKLAFCRACLMMS